MATTANQRLMEQVPTLFADENAEIRGRILLAIDALGEGSAAGLVTLLATGVEAVKAALRHKASASQPVIVDVDHDLGRWAQQLVDTQEEDGCLRLPASQPVSLPPQLRNSLYIRRSYRKLYDLLWDTCNKAVTPNQRPGFVVTGTPSIGKSAFALYLIQQLGKQRQIVFYEYPDESSRRRLKFDFSQRSGGPVVVHCMLASVRDVDLMADIAWHLVEGPPPRDLEFSGDTKTVVMVSPNQANFHTFLKGRYCRAPLYMPTWSLEELQACRQRLYSDVAADTAAERFSWLGGSIRLVLVKVDTDYQQMVHAAVQKGGAQELVRAIGEAVSHESNFSHRLGHFQVRSDFTVRYVNFASPRVSDLVLQQLATELQNSLHQFLVSSQDEAGLAGLRGVLFERHGHKVLQQGGSTCKWRQLQQPSLKRSLPVVSAYDDDEQEQQEPSHHFQTPAQFEEGAQQQQQQQQPCDVVQQLQSFNLTNPPYTVPSGLQRVWDDEALNLTSLTNAYIMPRSSNNAAWDAVLLGGDASQPLILQFTVSRVHGIKARPVVQLLDRMGSERSKAERLVFVVPPGVFDTFTWQPWQSVQGAVLARVPPALKALEQWVMEMKVQPTPRASSSSSGHNSRDGCNRTILFTILSYSQDYCDLTEYERVVGLRTAHKEGSSSTAPPIPWFPSLRLLVSEKPS